MKITQLAPNYAVSEQITPDVIPSMGKRGVDLIICNRPDNEAADQPDFDVIKQAANAEGIEAMHIPFSGSDFTQLHQEELSTYLAKYKNIHAYCRTGNRSTLLWNAVTAFESTEQAKKSIAKKTFDIVVIGAGSAGLGVIASVLKRDNTLRIAVVDGADNHYYQPGWTMVGGGVFSSESTRKTMRSVIPKQVTWIKQYVESFVPDDNAVVLDNQDVIGYQQLIIATGLTIQWSAIEGLEETLGLNGVTSNYRYDLAPYTWQLVRSLKKGKAVFTQPPMPIKCAGAPQKAMYLSSDYWFKQNAINDIDVNFYNAGQVLFGVDAFVPALESYVDKYQANLHFAHNLIKVDGEKKTAWFEVISDNEKTIVETTFDFLHVCPPQQAPECIQKSSLSDDVGWLDVDKHTLQHTRYSNIWGVGDINNTPNAKTMAAARKQVVVVAENIIATLNQQVAGAVYDGYGACPLTVERGKVVLAEFAYDGQLKPSLPKWLINGTKPTLAAWIMKATLLPFVYWQFMLKGYEWLAKPEKINR